MNREWLTDSEVVERFWRKVVRGGPYECWPWTARKRTGYGLFTPRYPSSVTAHRFAYELEVGPIPEGMHLDHLCRNRECCNPAHLEPVSPGENVLRGVGVTATLRRQTHCKRGHFLAGDNLLKTKNGSRQCKLCKRVRWHASRAPVEKEPATMAEAAKRATSGPVQEIPDGPVPHQLPKRASRPAHNANFNVAKRLG